MDVRVRAAASFVSAAALVVLSIGAASQPAQAGVTRMARSPYVGAIVIEAKTVAVLFEDVAPTGVRTRPAFSR